MCVRAFTGVRDHTQSAQSWRLASASWRRVLHEEAGLAHELAGALRLDPAGAVAALLGLGDDLLLVLLLLGGGDAVLQDGVEIGLDVVGVVLLLLLVLAFVVVPLGLDGRGRVASASSSSSSRIDVVVLGVEIELVDREVAVVEVVLVERVVIEVDGLVIEVFEVFLDVVLDGLVVVVSHCRPQDSGGSGGGSRRDYIEVVVDSGAPVGLGRSPARSTSGANRQQTPTMRGYGFTAAPPPGWISKCTWVGPPAALPVLPT